MTTNDNKKEIGSIKVTLDVKLYGEHVPSQNEIQYLANQAKMYAQYGIAKAQDNLEPKDKFRYMVEDAKVETV